MNEKLRFLWLLVVVVFGFVFHHFCANAIEALGKIIATNITSLPALAKFTAGMIGMFFFALSWMANAVAVCFFSKC